MGGKLSMKRVRLLGVAALLAAQGCGDSGAMPAPLGDVPDVVDDMDAGPRDASVRRDAGGDAGTVLGPLIEVTSPTATDDASSEDVVTGSTLTVRCSIAKNPKGEAVDPKTTKVSIYAGNDTKAAITQVATSTSESDIFQAENISLADLAHGVIRIECSGSDVATKVQSSAASIWTLYDAGPKITFINPRENGFVSVGDGKMGTDVVVRFKVEPQLLADEDEGGAIANVAASVGGKPIDTIEASTTEADTYSFPLDFSDTSLFTAIPKTLSLRVDASNKRRPKARMTSATLAVGVDSEGPTITVTKPARVGGQDPVVSGKVDVIMEIKDALAGVNNDTVEIRVEKLGGGKDTYRATSQGMGTFAASFETGSYPGLPSLNVTLVARDNVGIETTSNLSIDIDTVAPWLTLDAPTVREVNEKFPNPNDCTGAFDPLGASTPRDDGADGVIEGTIAGRAFIPRVIIWDRPLRLPSDSIVTRYAMIDNTTTRLYVQHNAGVPLLIDTDDDPANECDGISNNSEDTSKAPVVLVLSPVKAQGQGPLATRIDTSTPTPMTVQDVRSDPDASDLCVASISGSQPARLASDTSLTRVIKHVATGDNPVLYVDSPTSSGLRVTGKAYVSGREGWACLVAVAKDNAGNFGFTPPMRVCIDGGLGTCASAGPPPSCTDGCTIPAKFLADAPDRMPRLLYYRK